MIELTNIKTTDILGKLRGQINTMQNEIMADQPFVGALVNPSINYYMAEGDNATLTGTNTASTVKSYLTALCFPESNGVFVAGVWGMIQATAEPQFVGTDHDYSHVVIDVPAIKLATLDTSLSTFVSCEHLGLPSSAIPGLTTEPVQVNIADILFVRANNSLRKVTPSIEQGNGTCNIIFSLAV
jgi:hypothetical protein